MAAKFLCCLPLRLGVLVIAFVQFLLTGATAGLMWWLFREAKHESQLTKTLRISIVVIGVVYAISAIISLVGFIGALAKKLGAITAFIFILWITLALQIATTVFTLINYYRLRKASGSDCVVKSGDTTVDVCEQYAKVPQWAMIVSMSLPILLQLYACYIASAYKNRLLKQRQGRSSVAMDVNPTYTSVPATDQGYYAYASGPNAFGNRSHA